VWFASWILVNSERVASIKPFDPYPFSLLTMIVSLEAIFLSIWILISQNQMTRQADRRALSTASRSIWASIPRCT
jgi:uncharacterized membrane protein